MDITRLKKQPNPKIKFGIKVSKLRKDRKANAFIVGKIMKFYSLRVKPDVIFGNMDRNIKGFEFAIDRNKCAFKICGKYIYRLSTANFIRDLLDLTLKKIDCTDMFLIADRMYKSYYKQLRKQYTFLVI